MTYSDAELGHMLRKRGLSRRMVAAHLQEPERPRMRPRLRRWWPLREHPGMPAHRDERGRFVRELTSHIGKLRP